MNSDRRTLIVLGVIFAALVVAMVYQATNIERGSSLPPPAPTPVLSRVYPQLTASSIQAVQLRDPASGDALTMARNLLGEWVVSSEDDVRALDQDVASSVAGTLALLPYQRTFDVAENADLTQYGFAPEGDFYIQFITNNGEEHVIAVGLSAAPAPAFYGLVDDRQEIYLLDRGALDYVYSIYLNPPFE